MQVRMKQMTKAMQEMKNSLTTKVTISTTSVTKVGDLAITATLQARA